MKGIHDAPDDLDLLVEAAAVAGQLETGADPAVVAARTTHKRLVTVTRHGRSRPSIAHWTESEDDFLRANLGRLSEAEIGQRLGRSAYAVHMRWTRELRLTAPSRDPRVITAEQIALGLGMDGKSVHKLIDRGLLPGRRLPWNQRTCRVVDRVTLLRWMVCPSNWVYFRPERVGETPRRRMPRRVYDAEFWQKARRLVLRRLAAWDDEWWSVGQVAEYHGVTVRLVNKAIRQGRLPAVDWGNWWVLRSDATRPGLKVAAYRGKGGRGFFRKLASPTALAFMVLASAVGLVPAVIARMMGEDGRLTDYRLRSLKHSGRLAWLARRHNLPVRLNRRGEMLADWKAVRRRFPRVARVMDAFRRGKPQPRRDLELVHGVLKAWCRFFARTPAQHALARSLHSLGRRRAEHLRDVLRQMRAEGIDPYRRLAESV